MARSAGPSRSAVTTASISASDDEEASASGMPAARSAVTSPGGAGTGGGAAGWRGRAGGWPDCACGGSGGGGPGPVTGRRGSPGRAGPSATGVLGQAGPPVIDRLPELVADQPGPALRLRPALD